MQSGRLRALAVTAPDRSSVLPSVPTIREAGYPAAEGVEFFDLFVRAGTPDNIVAGLNSQVRTALQTQAFKDGLARQGLEPAGSTPDELKQLLKSDTNRWRATIKETGFRPIE